MEKDQSYPRASIQFDFPNEPRDDFYHDFYGGKFLFNYHFVPCVSSTVVQSTILFAGFKFDCRIYVAVTSFDPLMVYMYKEGLAR